MTALKLGALIGRGRTADVYAWELGYVLKRYHDDWPRENIDYEARIARIVHASGVASPSVGDIITVDGRTGLVYERLDGPSMDDVLFEQAERIAELAAVLARLHTAMHFASATDLPSQRTRILHAIECVPVTLLLPVAREHVLSLLESLADGTSLCHGDFHPANVIMTAPTPTVIDWENACLGSPLADVARTLLLFETAHLPYLPEQPDLIGPGITQFRNVYLQEYLTVTQLNPEPLADWRLILAAARLAEGISEEQQYLLSILPGQASTEY